MGQFSTFADLYRHMWKSYTNPTALNYQDHQGEWHAESTHSYLQKVRQLALGLVNRGLKRGDRIGIMSKPCPGWTIADLAIIMAGGVTVPLFGNQSPENLTFEVEQSGLKMLFVSGEAEWIKCTRHRDLFGTVISLESPCPDSLATPLSVLLKEGEAIHEERPNLWHHLEESCDADAVATIVYTSGSMGKPKGVQLSQRSLVSLIQQDPFQWSATQDRYLSFLPLAHIFARLLNFILLQSGMSIYYLEDPKALVLACHHVKPTILVLVPRLLEKLKTRLSNRIAVSGYILSRVGNWALRIAEREESGLWLRFQRFIADKLVYGSFRKAFGSKVRVIVSGGAKLNPHLANFFINMGFPIYEGWGMTEACPISCNTFAGRKIGTVGRPLDGMEVKVSAEGELLVSGPIVMKGYLNASEKDRTVDEEGWLHTGDQGTIDSEGYITILGRMKELLKTSTGEYVAPLPIEQELSKINLVDNALVIAEGRPYCTCLLFPDYEAIEGLKIGYGMVNLSDEQFLELPLIRDRLDQHIRTLNQHVNHWEEIRDYRFVFDLLTVESGYLTPTLKLRREVIVSKYPELITSMYEVGGRI